MVRSALRRPFTILIAIVGVLLTSVFALRTMPKDIFPNLGVPTIYVAQPYGGMDPAQMEGFLTYYYEYHFLYITGLEHVESKSIQGAAVIKLQFYPGTDMSQAMAETVSYVNRARAFTGIVAAVAGAAIATVVQIVEMMAWGWSIEKITTILMAAVAGGFVVGVLLPPKRPPEAQAVRQAI